MLLSFKSISQLAFLFAVVLSGCSNKPGPAPAPAVEIAPGAETAPVVTSPRTTFELSDRTVDLKSLLNAFPYDSFRRAASLKSSYFFTTKTEGTALRIYRVGLPDVGSPMMPISAGAVVPNVDISKSLSFRWKIRETDGVLYFSMDENSNEQFNIYRLDVAAGSVERLTNVAYITGYEFSPDEKKIAYLARVEPKENSRIQLHVMDLETKQDVIIATDDEKNSFTWSTIAWSPNAEKIAVDVIENGDRNLVNVGLVTVSGNQTQKPSLLTQSKVRPSADVVKEWLNEKEVLFRSSEDGVTNLYSVNVETKEKKKLTNLKADVEEARRTQAGEKVYYLLSTSSAKGGSIQRWDVQSGDIVEIFRSSDDLSMLDARGNEVLINATGHRGPLNVYRAVIENPIPANTEPSLGLGLEVEKQVVHCKSEEIRYKTFDDITYQVEGEEIKGEILATLYTPLKPAPADKAKGLVRSFYGGSLYFDTDAQVLCALGYTVLSPAARGDGSISAAFEKINDGDLGGKEIVDIIYGGKYLSEKSGIPAERLGVFGHSHGGYATQRLLTFPGKVDGIEANFAWAFGIANSGFADIVEQTNGSNIPGWTKKEAGDPTIPEVRKKLLDRSPISHVDRLTAKLLLVHGDADKRVPYSGSKMIYDRLVADHKGELVQLVTIPGMGHAPVAQNDLLLYYGAWIEFLK